MRHSAQCRIYEEPPHLRGACDCGKESTMTEPDERDRERAREWENCNCAEPPSPLVCHCELLAERFAAARLEGEAERACSDCTDLAALAGETLGTPEDTWNATTVAAALENYDALRSAAGELPKAVQTFLDQQGTGEVVVHWIDNDCNPVYECPGDDGDRSKCSLCSLEDALTIYAQASGQAGESGPVIVSGTLLGFAFDDEDDEG